MKIVEISKSQYFNLLYNKYEVIPLNEDDKYIFFEIKKDYITTFGYIVLKKLDKKLEIYDIYIEPKMRNLGYGSKSIKYVIDYAINNNYESLIISNHKKMNMFLEKNQFININGVYVLEGLNKITEYKNSMYKTSIITLSINLILSILKFLVGIISGLNIFILDAINSISDSFSIILTLIGYKIGFSVEDEEHPLGHDKIESIFSLIIGVVLTFSTFIVLKDLIISIYKKDYLNTSIEKNTVYVAVIFLIFKFLQYIYIFIKNKKYENELLKTLLIDYRSDILLNFSIILGILISIYLDKIFENIVSIIISFILIKNGISLIIDKINILMDTQNKHLLLEIKMYIIQNYEIENVHDMYMIRIGRKINIYADIRLDGSLSLETAHDIAEIIQKDIRARYVDIDKVMFHMEPMYKE